eukprot:TRINITY_DN1542_c0_g1_i10.p1 TRINITY_DN1542_c0_g1~~TRINITY_DN1542_c0_g1_i10.p1  ORF type:complete len:113 (-),score=0.30 TRINITY_DN1542_c0_g1_i10:68-406(-)
MACGCTRLPGRGASSSHPQTTCVNLTVHNGQGTPGVIVMKLLEKCCNKGHWVAIDILNTAALNSYLLFRDYFSKKSESKTLTLKQFKLQQITELVEATPVKKKAHTQPLKQL